MMPSKEGILALYLDVHTLRYILIPLPYLMPLKWLKIAIEYFKFKLVSE